MVTRCNLLHGAHLCETRKAMCAHQTIHKVSTSSIKVSKHHRFLTVYIYDIFLTKIRTLVFSQQTAKHFWNKKYRPPSPRSNTSSLSQQKKGRDILQGSPCLQGQVTNRPSGRNPRYRPRVVQLPTPLKSLKQWDFTAPPTGTIIDGLLLVGVWVVGLDLDGLEGK